MTQTVHVLMCMCMHVYTYVCVLCALRVRVCVCVHAHVCACMRACIRAYVLLSYIGIAQLVERCSGELYCLALICVL